MHLFKIGDFNPRYREEAFDGEDVKGLDVYAGRTDEKIGSIDEVLVDGTGHFRYLVIDTGFWIFGKKVLLPVGRCHVDVKAQRVYALGLTNKDQAEKLPEYHDSMTVDYDYEERVRSVYRTPPVEASAPVEMSPPVEASGAQAVSRHSVPRQVPASDERSTYTYEQEPSMYQMNEQDHQRLKLYEERLIAHKNRRQTGEVKVGKRVETETAKVSVPVEKEQIIIERNKGKVGNVVPPREAQFQEGEVTRMEVYDESAKLEKQAVVREEVDIRKEVKQDTVEAAETLRREELEVDVEGNSTVDPVNLPRQKRI